MTNPVLVVRTASYHGQERPVWRHGFLWCPACEAPHSFTLVGPHGDLPPGGERCTWGWDGDTERPTLTGSILANADLGHPGMPRCHSFVTAGQWVFLDDCTHAMAGQTVDLVPLPDWLCRGD